MKKEKDPELQEKSKKLLIITPSPNNPSISPIVSLFLNINKNSTKITDKYSKYKPAGDNTGVSNGNLEELMKRKDCSLFVYLYSNKSNRIRLVIGRTFEYSITEIIQYEIAHSIERVDLVKNILHLTILHRNIYNKHNLLLDILRDSIPSTVELKSVKYVVGVTEVNETDQSNQLKDHSSLSTASSSTPPDRLRIDLLEVEVTPFKLVHLLGPIELKVIEETRISETEQKIRSKVIRQTKKKIKNIEEGPLNSKIGILHIERQDLREIELSKGRAIRGGKRK